MNALPTLLSTPRGITYALLTVLLLLGWVTGLEFVKWAAVAFLAYALALTAMDQFKCLKCWLGLVSSAMFVLAAFELISPRFYVLAFVLMWSDAWLHAAG